MRAKNDYSIEYVAKRLIMVKDCVSRIDLFGQTRLTVWYSDNDSQTFLIHSCNKKYADEIMKYVHNKKGH